MGAALRSKKWVRVRRGDVVNPSTGYMASEGQVHAIPPGELHYVMQAMSCGKTVAEARDELHGMDSWEELC